MSRLSGAEPILPHTPLFPLRQMQRLSLYLRTVLLFFFYCRILITPQTSLGEGIMKWSSVFTSVLFFSKPNIRDSQGLHCCPTWAVNNSSLKQTVTIKCNEVLLRPLMLEQTLRSTKSLFLYNFLPFITSRSLNSRLSATPLPTLPSVAHTDTTIPGNQNKKQINLYDVRGRP